MTKVIEMDEALPPVVQERPNAEAALVAEELSASFRDSVSSCTKRKEWTSVQEYSEIARQLRLASSSSDPVATLAANIKSKLYVLNELREALQELILAE